MGINAIFENHIRTGYFNHGYLLVGPKEIWQEAARKAAGILLNQKETLLDSHPDFYQRSFDSFGINESHFLRNQASMKPISAKKRVFLFDVCSLTFEAANALLKLLEEPPKTCHFFIILPFVEDVSPALRSRLTVLFGNRNFELNEEKLNFYKNFLKMEAARRLSAVKNIAFDKKKALEFLLELEIVLSRVFHDLRCRENVADIASRQMKIIDSLDEIRLVRQYLSDRAPSSKMILEHFALTLPQF